MKRTQHNHTDFESLSFVQKKLHVERLIHRAQHEPQHKGSSSSPGYGMGITSYASPRYSTSEQARQESKLDRSHATAVRVLPTLQYPRTEISFAADGKRQTKHMLSLCQVKDCERGTPRERGAYPTDNNA